jgi:hypothetical protein
MIRKSEYRFSDKHALGLDQGDHAQKGGSGRDMTKPTAKQIKAMADVGGVLVDADVAARIAHSIGPAFEGFAPVAGTLPFDLEPATFMLVQNAEVSQ